EGDNFPMFGSSAQFLRSEVGVLVGLVRVDADAGPDVGFALGGADHPLPFRAPGGNVEEAPYPRGARSLEHTRLFLGDALVFQVAVAVDQHQAASLSGSSIRGNRPSGLSSR